MISVAVNSLNEGQKLEKCLSSVSGWADEIVVVDMESSDNTTKVAEKFRAKVFVHKKVDYVEPVRSFALSKTTGDWVLILDPDETVTKELKTRLSEVIKKDDVVAVNIPRLNFVFNKKIKHTNFWPDKHIRFFKRDKVIFSEKIHSYPQVKGEVLQLPNTEDLAIQHTPYQNSSEYLKRMQRYSDIEARNLFSSGVRFSIINLIYKPLYDFVRRYIRHLGFLDGLVGLQLSFLQAYYYFLVEIKLLSIKKE